MSDKSRLAALGGVGAALVAGFCCIGAPLTAAGMVGAAGAAIATEPLRPVFLLLAAALLVLAFRLGRKGSGGIATLASGGCARSNGGSFPFLWFATALAILLAPLPIWIPLVR